MIEEVKSDSSSKGASEATATSPKNELSLSQKLQSLKVKENSIFITFFGQSSLKRQISSISCV
jgi:hypothetical protein